MCRHDHGLTWTEFQNLTLGQLEALEERRMIAVRHARFNAGLVATILYNSRPGIEDPIEVWDFLPGFERDQENIEKEKTLRSVRQGVYVAFTRMGHITVEQARKEAAAMVDRMTTAGTEDADAIVREVFEEVIQQPFEIPEEPVTRA